jgi:hypothetical protein
MWMGESRSVLGKRHQHWFTGMITLNFPIDRLPSGMFRYDDYVNPFSEITSRMIKTIACMFTGRIQVLRLTKTAQKAGA